MRGADRESSRTCGEMRWTRKLRLTSVTRADGEVVWSWRPTLALSFVEMICEATVAKQLAGRNSEAYSADLRMLVGAIRGVYHRARIRATRWLLRLPATHP